MIIYFIVIIIIRPAVVVVVVVVVGRAHRRARGAGLHGRVRRGHAHYRNYYCYLYYCYYYV